MPATANQSLSVCVLDDDPSALKGTSRLLVSEGWKVQAFDDPVPFLSYAKTHRPKVVVIDIWMPLMNGLEVQSRLREVSPSTSVIISTGKEDALIRDTALQAGAAAFFVKPFDDEEFLSVVRMTLTAVD